MPKLIDYLQDLLKGKLKKSEFGTLQTAKFDSSKKSGKRKIVVFILGGATYQELRALHRHAAKGNYEYILGSNVVLNSER